MNPAQIRMIMEAAIELLEVVRDRDEDNTIELEDFFPRIAALREELKAGREARRQARKE